MADISLESVTGKLNRIGYEAFIQALEGFGTRDFGGVRVHYDRNNHAGLDYVDVTMIGSNGHLVG